MVERYIDGDRAGILVHCNWGVGFATDNTQYNPDIAIDKRVIEKYLSGATIEDMHEYLPTIGYENVSLGGWDDALDIEWHPLGTRFYIDDYDGLESVVTDEEFTML